MRYCITFSLLFLFSPTFDDKHEQIEHSMRERERERERERVNEKKIKCFYREQKYLKNY